MSGFDPHYPQAHSFDPDTIDLMLAVLDDVSCTLGADESTRSRLARRILSAVTSGERDPARLRADMMRSAAN